MWDHTTYPSTFFTYMYHRARFVLEITVSLPLFEVGRLFYFDGNLVVEETERYEW